MINKIEIIGVDKNELPALIYLSYEGDTELLDKYHVKKFNIDEAVEYELELIKIGELDFDWKYFKILYATIPIGYAVAFGDFIFSFCICIKYRVKNIMKQWWEMMVYTFGEGIKFGLVNNNERAINYLKKRGMVIGFENEDKKEVLLTF